jgi:hypothetical protein
MGVALERRNSSTVVANWSDFGLAILAADLLPTGNPISTDTSAPPPA